jgi:hypothetical protein
MSSEPFDTLNSFRASPEERLAAAAELARTFRPDKTAVCEIDLHCHSFISDGYSSPSAVVFDAFRRRMQGVAISDHDLVDGQEEALAAGRIFGVDVIAAVEFYTDRPGIEISAHFPDAERFLRQLKSGAFAKVCEPIRAAKVRQLSAMMGRVPTCFAALGFKAEITSADIDRYVRNGVSTKGDISVIMWQKYGPELAAAGLAIDVKDFQARYTTQDKMLNLPLELDMDLSPVSFVRRIRAWGGLPGLAHPTELRKKEGLGNDALYKTIVELAEAGLQTVEVDGWRNGVCPETGRLQTDVFEEMRQTYNKEHPQQLPLLFTNGSDNHDQPGEGLELGCGRNGNLRPEFGGYENIASLRKRGKMLAQ